MTRQALRMDASGNIAPLQPGGWTPRGFGRIVFLVHGFNNDEIEAGASYASFRRGVDEVLRKEGIAERSRRNLQETIWEFCWPGFERWPFTQQHGTKRTGRDQGYTAALYAKQVRKARKFVGSNLANYIISLRPREVLFIGHSLGARVVLECIKRLLASPGLPTLVSGILLMAAAVPIDYVGRGGALNQAGFGAQRRYCFYSRVDPVLAFAFPPGEVMAGEAPIYGLPLAVGLTGSPRATWSIRRNTWFGHSGYWTGSIRYPANQEASNVLAGLFGAVTSRALTMDVPITVRLAGDRILPTWRLEARNIQGADWLADLCAATPDSEAEP